MADLRPVVVISEALWLRQFGRSTKTVGSTLALNGFPFTVIGVVRAPFEGVEFGQPAEIWMPMMMVRRAMTRSPDDHWLTARSAGWLTLDGLERPAFRSQPSRPN